MAITNPFSVAYGSRIVGGSTSFLLHGPYVLDKTFEELRVVFDVIITRDSYADLKSAAESLEDDFSKRDQNIVITLDGSTFTFTHGTTLLNSRASISKSGSPDTDKGYSRAYTVVLEGGLPATDNSGLRDLSMNVKMGPERQKVVTFVGVYTPHGGNDASAQYLADFDTEASTLLAAVDGSKSWELVDEDYTPDRNDHTCSFTRQYEQILFPQSSGGDDHANIRGHRVVFTDLASYPGDSIENIQRLRRVVGTYDCAVDVEVTDDLQSVYEGQVKDHLLSTFQDNFSPKVFAVEDLRLAYDETSNRMSVQIQYVYQKDGGDDIVEVSQSLAFRERRTIDYTPVHEDDEHAAEADAGWASLERVASRTVIVIGNETPKRRIGEDPEEGLAGKIEGIEAGKDVQPQEGWNITDNVSQVRKSYIGDPGEEQITVTVLTENVVERFHRSPSERQSLTFGGAS